jgi:hypothetical protein
MSQPGPERPPEPREKNARPKALARIHLTKRLLPDKESIVNHRPSRTHRALIFLEVKSPFSDRCGESESGSGSMPGNIVEKCE